MTFLVGGRDMKKFYVSLVSRIRRSVLARRPDLFTNFGNEKYFGSHLVTLLAIYDVDALIAMRLPWWTYKSAKAIEQHFLERKQHSSEEITSFEWGSGASTSFLEAISDDVKSVEYDEKFYEILKSRVSHKTLLIYQPPVPSSAPVQRSRKKGFGNLDFQQYVETIDRFDQQLFDIIVIDGRAREACLSKSIEKLKPGGMIVFDNMLRPRYKKAVKAESLKHRLVINKYFGLTPSLPYLNSTWVIRKEP